MSSILRGSRSYIEDQKRKDRQRQLVLDALVKQQQVQTDDKLLLDVVSAIPRSTPQRIEEVLSDLRRKDEQAAEQLENAIEHCNDMAKNLSGMKPDLLWTEPVRVLWTECIQALTKQTARWKITPIVLIHPFCGTITVLNSLCGKYQAKSEYARMQNFMDSLKDGLEEVLDTIPTIRDEKTGTSLSRDEVKDILLDLSNATSSGDGDEGHLSENVSEEEEEEKFAELNNEVERVSEDWTNDKIDDLTTGESRLTPMIKPLGRPKYSKPQPVLTLTPPRSLDHSISSSLSDFNNPLFHYEESPTKPAKPVPTSSPMEILSPVKLTNQKPVNRALFGNNDRKVSFTPSPKLEPPTTPMSETTKVAPDLSSVYPDGYTVVPVRNSKNRKSDAKKIKEPKKRPVSSPNYPSSKATRLDQTEMAINQLQMGQANQNEMLAKLTNQLGTLAFNLGLHLNKKDNGN